MLRIAIPAFFTLLISGSTAQAQLSNPGFETVTITTTDTTVLNWVLDDFGSGISSQSHSGTYAISVWNRYWYGRGILHNGTGAFVALPFKNQPYLYGGEPIAFKPIALHGFYLYDTLYTQSNDDTALVQITLSRFNITSGEREAVGFGEAFLTYTNQYEPFVAHVNYTSSLMPDTVTVSMMSSLNGFCGPATSGVCLYLTVDDLSLESPTGLVEFAHINEEVRVYPNPAGVLLNIDATAMNETAMSCELVTIGGKVIMQENMIANKTVLNTSGLEPGLYFYLLKNHQGQVLHTGRAQILR